MAARPSLEQLPMTPGYFRLILRSFGDTPERRAAILAGTGVTEAMVHDQPANISLFQQVRQVENLGRLFGEGWALRSPELWNPPSHGALGTAALAARDIAGMVEVLVWFAYVRAPFYELSLRSEGAWRRLDYAMTVPIDEGLWRPMIEISFIGIRTLFATILGRRPSALEFAFACTEPDHSADVRTILGDQVTYDAPLTAMRFPAEWLTFESPFADDTLLAAAVHELQVATQRVSQPAGLLGRVERLLSTLPASRLGAEEVARRCGVSRRTLVRRLAESGSGYRRLADAELRGRAERLLQSGALTHAQIAAELGYADPTSFSRACRRWFRGDGPNDLGVHDLSLR